MATHNRKIRGWILLLSAGLLLASFASCQRKELEPTMETTKTPETNETDDRTEVLSEQEKTQAYAAKRELTELRFAYALLESDRKSVEQARTAYDALNGDQKKLVGTDLAKKLTDCEKALARGEPALVRSVTEFGAKGDGETNDRAAIQAAILAVSEAGGGRVVLDAGKTFVSGNLRILSGVELHFGDGAVLKQTERDDEFVNPLKDYSPFPLTYGYYMESNIEWDAAAFYNFPYIMIKDAENVAITGKGTVRLSAGNSPKGPMTMQAIGLNDVVGYRFTDFKVVGYQAYCMKAVACENGLYAYLDIDASESPRGGTDGIALNNSHNIRVTNNNLLTGDDGIYVCSTYKDPREGLWYTTDHPRTPSHIEIDHNHCEVTWDATKAFCFILWGSQSPDLVRVEVSDIYVHDNYFQTMGAWPGNWNLETHTFDFNGSNNPAKMIRMENNEIGSIQENFFAVPVSDFYGFDSMASVANGDFQMGGELYWVSRVPIESGAFAGSAAEGNNRYGVIRDLDKGDAALYEGIHLMDKSYRVTARVRSSGDPVRLFVRNQVTQELIASLTVTDREWKNVSLEFSAPQAANYQIGIERGQANAGFGEIDDLTLEAVAEPLNTVLVSQTPDKTLSGKTGDYGVTFETKFPCRLSAVRLFVTPSDTGMHQVKILDGKTGNRIGGPYDWTVAEGTEGWTEFLLPEALALSGKASYTVTVSVGPGGVVPVSEKAFENGLDRPYLRVDRTGGYGPQGSTEDNYFRDVVLEIQGDMPLADLPCTATRSTQLQDVLGLRFTSSEDGVIPLVRMFCVEQMSGTHVVTLWNYETKTLIAGPFDWEIQAGTSGWQVFALPEPVEIEANITYALGISVGSNCVYAVGEGQLDDYVDSHYITVPPDGALYSGNANLGLAHMPGNPANGGGTSANNYMRDIVFIPNQS